MLPSRIALLERILSQTFLLFAFLLPATAADPMRFTWTDAVSGNWSDTTKWTDDQASGSGPVTGGLAGYVLEFEEAGRYTATQDLGAGFLISELRFGGSEVTLAGNGIRLIANGASSPEIQQDGTADVTINTPVMLLADLNCGGIGSGKVTLGGGVSGNAGLTKSGSGILAVTGTASYSGNTTVEGGTLKLSQSNTANDASTVTIGAGAVLDLNFSGQDTVLSLVLGGIPQANGVYHAANSGGAISGTGSIRVFTPPPPQPSSNANLSALNVSGATLSPAFNSLIGTYSTTVPNAVSGITVMATAAHSGAAVKVGGNQVSSGVASPVIPLSVGNNLITTLVTAQDGVTTRIYTISINRAAPVAVATAPALVISSARATLNGTVNPNGVATVYFEYGPTAAYGSRTPERDVAGTGGRPFAASLGGLKGATIYHFRAVVIGAGGTQFGNGLSFATPPEPPVAATGTPTNVTASTATLVGGLNPNGVKASAYFEYGLTSVYGQATAVQNIPAGAATVNVQAPNISLISGATYHYRLVASNAAGTALGEDVVFTVQPGGGGGSGAPTAAPAVHTGNAVGVGTESAILQGSANPNEGTTLVQFEYGLTAAYGQTSVLQGIGNGNGAAAVAATVSDLLPGTTYHYRVTASNNLGKSLGADATFTTGFPPPTAVTGNSTVLTTTSVKLDGSIRARGATAEAWIDYGTDGVTFNSVRAVPANVSGDLNTEVSAEVPELAQGVTYYFRVRAVGPQGQAMGEVKGFDVASLSGLIRQFPPGVTAANRQGSVSITLGPAAIGSGWRFAGEQFWRESGVPATGLTAGDRVIEFRPVPGYLKPANETVAVASIAAPVALFRSYAPSAEAGTGALTVFLKPQDLTEGIAPARWKFFGEGDAEWKESGTTVNGLAPGNYVILSKQVEGRSTPHPVTAVVAHGQTTSLTIIYYIKEGPVGVPPDLLAFEEVSGDEALPNAYVGQIRTNSGSGSGFVVRPRVVVTAGHVLFNDGTLSAATGAQWLFQHDRQAHDPVPQTPRGFFLMTGYAAQRAEDNSPGISTPASQNLDAGTLFFVQEAGRGGFSGYLASDTSSNEFLLSSALKTVAGYPIDGIGDNGIDRMHATPPAAVNFTKSFERTYITPDVRASAGASGGPLCVLNENGGYYPAAIYLGGTNQTVVRALDSDVVTMIGFSEASSGAAAGATGGSLSNTQSGEYDSETHGALRVIIEPAAARAAGAGWRLDSASSYVFSGDTSGDLEPGAVSISFPTVQGFVPPAPQAATVTAGTIKTVTFTYEETVDGPVITSATAVTGVRGEGFSYQISADHSPLLYSLRGLLPDGLEFHPQTGIISGIPQEAGIFPVTVGASNSGGAGTRELVLTFVPVVADQAFTAPYLVAMNYQVESSETGDAGSSWAASGLPAGVSIHPSSGIVSGTATEPGVYEAEVSTAVRGATGSGTLTLTVTGTAPRITQQPAATRSIQYGTSAALVVEATGLPDPSYQWYRGQSGDTSHPVEGATSPLFTTPPLTANTSYWVRAHSISGSADSTTSSINILPSANANLIGLVTSEGPIEPFSSTVTAYAINVPNEVSAILVTPQVEVTQSTVKVKNVVVPTDAASDPIALGLGANVINVDVISGDGSVTKRYVLSVNRSQTPVLVTGTATGVRDMNATLRGMATPNGMGTVFFQYSTTTDFGNATAGDVISGNLPLAIEEPVTGLRARTTYHYRIGITTGAGTSFASYSAFTTSSAPPVVATGQASDIEATKVKLIGGVNTNGTTTSVHFEWGETTAYGNTTPVQVVPGGASVVDISYMLQGLTPDTIYHYRLVGNSTAGTTFGEDVVFIANQATGGSGIPTAIPAATTGGSQDVTGTSVALQGVANPKGGTTFVRFEYGLTPSYGHSTQARGIGSGTDPSIVVAQATGLLPGRTYHYRLVATNSSGTGRGEDRTFATSPMGPLATTLGATALSSTSVRLFGTANANGALAQVFFEYGTDGVSFPNRIAITGGSVNGEVELPVQVDLADLEPDKIYHFRTFAVRPDNFTIFSRGEVKSFRSDNLAGLLQKFPRELDVGERQGQLQVNLAPAGMGAWRLAGEIQWRASGSMATGLTTGDREIEFLPVLGYHQPGRELVGVVSGSPTLVLNREYFVSPTPPDSSIKVNLIPVNRSGPEVPLSDRIQWRLFGYDDLPWRESGETASGLMPGSYLIEFKAALDLDAPPPCTLVLGPGESKVVSFAYDPDLDSGASSIRVLPYDTVSTRRNQPYAYVGQIRNDTGSHSGFAVKTRVVATVAQSVFDEFTLAQIPGVQWLFQQDRAVHEPKPQTPRGFYVFDGYAAQREQDDTPGFPSLAAQEMNVAALYFLEDAGRGGYSGFLATDEATQPLATATSLKTLVGYPVRGGGSISNHGRMQASRTLTDAFVPVTDVIFGSSTIMGLHGMDGGPLCIQTNGGNYFPAGIYVGGSNSQNHVRAIDGEVIDLFNRAELTANTGNNNNTGGISQTSYTAVSASSTRGALSVIIEPAEARLAGALWKLGGDSSFVVSGARKNNMMPGQYVLQLKTIPGFRSPVQQSTNVLANNLTTVTFTYLPELSPLFNWRQLHFATTANTGDAADGSDPDGDGILNLDEYIAGTDPLNRSDAFFVSGSEREGNTFLLTVPVKAGRLYILQRSTNLPTADWTDVVTAGPFALGGTRTLVDPAATSSSGIYRVKVELLGP
ncbi:cadherin-like beta sandwich domain-containing protein [Luteolibacter luteus]|uniref:Fibronectin type-III domain-containing protein n=1 Tax=Luteolibacter luteus TaxID=2728835 RepID=A0A858RK63_9BACT|nr:cadherin-like beta sandwich domain-containing protein [Luteolibacter luteus]QJE97252.1 hypothetical protein HHL09_16135 [Luteolibacter luteus]